MNIFPAIDLYSGKAVRLFKGDYDNMTVFNDNPQEVALDFVKKGAKFIHIVDLEGAKTGEVRNLGAIEKILNTADLFAEIGGGIRSMETIEKYISVGANRIILGTAAVTNEVFLENAVAKYGDKIAVGVDIKDGYVAIKGWTEKSQYKVNSFFEKLQKIGVKTVICTDISKDGAMQGTNFELYSELEKNFDMNIIASGGVSSISDIERLAKLGIYGAIIGKAYYIGAIDLAKAIEVAK
ncbi:MAG: 1-(5-phosphoribosyl)-5-[(5-phosphoribosylamino)methylideneamino]imidazole-4-carboxamide isomerase [Firmicutes bacterium]|nr:1-(5-phosphoribosyl)-5-[(5-phosphoribosylamino)methylideneamino]imidazole-4-carboxamide isomerase [Bacillota bacterium]